MPSKLLGEWPVPMKEGEPTTPPPARKYRVCGKLVGAVRRWGRPASFTPKHPTECALHAKG